MAISRRSARVGGILVSAVAFGLFSGWGAAALDDDATSSSDRAPDQSISPALIAEGQRVFRFDTFGNEQLWTDKLRLHEVVEKNVDPTTALAVGLKVDSDVLPPGILEKVDLKSLATTVALLKRNAGVGLQ